MHTSAVMRYMTLSTNLYQTNILDEVYISNNICSVYFPQLMVMINI
jgi:hypothetical protein